jgi:hypothetical protein
MRHNRPLIFFFYQKAFLFLEAQLLMHINWPQSGKKKGEKGKKLGESPWQILMCSLFLLLLVLFWV